MHQLRIALRSMIPIILHLHTATPNNVGWVIANSLSIMINEYTNEWSHIVIFSPHRFISFNTQYIFYLFLLLPRLSWIIWFHVEKEIDGSHIYQQFSWQIVQYANILAWWFYGDKFFFLFHCHGCQCRSCAASARRQYNGIMVINSILLSSANWEKLWWKKFIN